MSGRSFATLGVIKDSKVVARSQISFGIAPRASNSCVGLRSLGRSRRKVEAEQIAIPREHATHRRAPGRQFAFQAR